MQGQFLLADCLTDGSFQLVQVHIALIAQRNHGATLEFHIQLDAKNDAERQHKGHKAAGERIEFFAVAGKVDAGGLAQLAALCGSAVQDRLAQRLDTGRAANHHAGGPHAKHKVQQHTGEQRKAEGINGTCGGGSEPRKDRSEQSGPDAIGGAKRAHQNDCHNDDGHVAVNDGGQAHLKAAGNGSIQRFALVQFLADTGSSDNVCIHTHADAQNDTGDAGQCQRGTGENREIPGNHSQRGGHLSQQRQRRDGAGQTIVSDHQQGDHQEGNDTGQHHHFQAARAQGGADGGIALGGQRKRQCAGVYLVRQRGDGFLIKAAADDGAALGDGFIDRGGGDVHIIQPDGDHPVFFRGQFRGGGAELFGALAGEFQLNYIAVLFIVSRRGGFHIIAGEDQLPVSRGAAAEHHLGRGADLVNGRLGIEVRLIALPRKTDDDAVFVVVHIILIIRDAKADQTILNNGLGGVHLIIRRIHAVGGHEGHIHAAPDVNAKTDVRRPLQIDVSGIPVGIAYTKDRCQGKRNDQHGHDKKLPCLPFFAHRNLQISS